MTISVLELGIAVVNQPANRRRTECSCSFSKYIWDRENDNFFDSNAYKRCLQNQKTFSEDICEKF